MDEFDRLPGESDDSRLFEDARHWRQVYSELAGYCERAVAEQAGGERDRRLRRRLAFYRLRKEHWERRMNSFSASAGARRQH